MNVRGNHRLLAAALVLAAASSAPAPLLAHAPDIGIAGYQYFWTADLEGAGHAGILATPVAPIEIPLPDNGTPLGNAAATTLEEKIADVVNHDPFGHTFSECTGNCDGTFPVMEDPLFHVLVPGRSTRPFVLLPRDPDDERRLERGTYRFFCTTHSFMRGEITFT